MNHFQKNSRGEVDFTVLEMEGNIIWNFYLIDSIE